MASKEEILKRISDVGVKRVFEKWYDGNLSFVYDSMDEYAKQRSEAFLQWVADKNLCPNRSNLWFDYTLSRDDVRFYTIEQLYNWFDTGVKFVLPPLKIPNFTQK